MEEERTPTVEGSEESELVLTEDHCEDFEDIGFAYRRRFLETEELGDMNTSLGAFRMCVQLTPEDHEALPLRLGHLGIAFMDRFEAIGDVPDITEGIDTLQRAVELVSDDDSSQAFLLANLGNALDARFSATGDLDDLSQAIIVTKEAIRLTPESDPDYPGWVQNLGYMLRSRFAQFGDSDDLTEGIALLKKAVRLATSADDPRVPKLFENLGHLLELRFKALRDVSDLNEEIEVREKVVNLSAEGHRELPARLNALAISYQSLFSHSNNPDDLTKAISTQERTVGLMPDGHPELPTILCNLGNSFHLRFKHTTNPEDIDRAISTIQRAVDLAPDGHEDKPGLFLTNLGNCLRSRSEKLGDAEAIERAIKAHQKAVYITPPRHANLPACLTNLAFSFNGRYTRTNDTKHLDEAISAFRRAVDLTPDTRRADLSTRLGQLGASLNTRFTRLSHAQDVDEAIVTLERAVELAPERAAHIPSILAMLVQAFENRFDTFSELSDLSSAIEASTRAVNALPSGSPDAPSRLHSLGNLHRHRFRRGGDLEDLAETISTQQRAVLLAGDSHKDVHTFLNSLGIAFQNRFERLGDVSDINEAITLQSRAANLTPADHPGLSGRYNELGISFLTLAHRTDNPVHTSQAVSALRMAVEVGGGEDVNLPSMLTNLGNALRNRFSLTGDADDIDEAVASFKKAEELTLNGHSERYSILFNLGDALQARYRRSFAPQDISDAILKQQEALELIPEGHADLPAQFITMAHSFHTRYDSEKNDEDLKAAISLFKSAATCTFGPPDHRFEAARLWAKVLRLSDPQSPDIIVAFDAAIGTLALMAGLEQTVNLRYQNLRQVSNISSEAAAAAFYLGRVDKAVEWLEQGRCLVWSQLNHLRTPLDDLRLHDPTLAQEILETSQKLETAASTRSTSHVDMSISEKISVEDQARDHLKSARNWDDLVRRARAIPGFERFLLPTSSSDTFNHLPPSGTIVIVNLHSERCDAIALGASLGEPLHIPLLDFGLDKAKAYCDSLNDRLLSEGLRMRGEPRDGEERLEDRALGRYRKRGAKERSGIREVLRGLWTEVVKPVLCALGYSRLDEGSHSDKPRIWWCPTGPLSFLPLHAAGIYEPENFECILDYAVSSYTVTIGALTSIIKSEGQSGSAASGLFLTSQPDAPCAMSIPGTTHEVTSIYAQACSRGVRVLKVEGNDLSVDACLSKMELFSCIHFACHASQNAAEPLRSCFLFHNGSLDLSTIMQRNLKNADLAFLSACQTSMGEEKLSNEAVHLAAGMIAAGYRRVVATMWSINDAYAPDVANDFYEYLWTLKVEASRGDSDGSQSAHALHHAIHNLRRRLGDSERALLAWVPYVHFGY